MLYIFSIIIYFASLLLVLSLFLPKRTFGLNELVKSFLLSTLLITAQTARISVVCYLCTPLIKNNKPKNKDLMDGKNGKT